jgi:phospholipid/cholesterol/gamma-HCH transport system permease protein
MPTAPLPASAATDRPASGVVAALHRATAAIGRAAHASVNDSRRTLGFIGELLQATTRVLGAPLARRRSRTGSLVRSHLRGSDLLAQLELAGPRSLPIVSLVSGLVGVILAYMGAVQLQRFGAQSFIADLVAVGAVREVAALMTGVILSGRIGAAYAAQLGSMQANEEIDALRALGVDPMEHLVLPRVLALTLMAPLLTAYGALVAVAAGGLVAAAVFGVPMEQYGYKVLQALTLPHVLVGLGKGTVYGLLVALAGCRQGLHAGRSAQAVGQAVTASVVQAIVWIVVAASAMTIALQRLGW